MRILLAEDDEMLADAIFRTLSQNAHRVDAVRDGQQADDALQPMRLALDATGVPYNTHRAIGSTVDEITKFAKENYCPQIVIGPAGAHWFKALFVNSLTRRVAAMMRASSDKACEVL